MKSGMGTFALRFAAMAVLLAPAAALAQGSSQSVCRYVWGPRCLPAAACLQRGLLSPAASTNPTGGGRRATRQALTGGQERDRGAKGAVARHRAPSSVEFN